MRCLCFFLFQHSTASRAASHMWDKQCAVDRPASATDSDRKTLSHKCTFASSSPSRLTDMSPSQFALDISGVGVSHLLSTCGLFSFVFAYPCLLLWYFFSSCSPPARCAHPFHPHAIPHSRNPHSVPVPSRFNMRRAPHHKRPATSPPTASRRSSRRIRRAAERAAGAPAIASPSPPASPHAAPRSRAPPRPRRNVPLPTMSSSRHGRAAAASNRDPRAVAPPSTPTDDSATAAVGDLFAGESSAPLSTAPVVTARIHAELAGVGPADGSGDAALSENTRAPRSGAAAQPSMSGGSSAASPPPRLVTPSTGQADAGGAIVRQAEAVRRLREPAAPPIAATAGGAAGAPLPSAGVIEAAAVVPPAAAMADLVVTPVVHLTSGAMGGGVRQSFRPGICCSSMDLTT